MGHNLKERQGSAAPGARGGGGDERAGGRCGSHPGGRRRDAVRAEQPHQSGGGGGHAAPGQPDAEFFERSGHTLSRGIIAHAQNGTDRVEIAAFVEAEKDRAPVGLAERVDGVIEQGSELRPAGLGGMFERVVVDLGFMSPLIFLLTSRGAGGMMEVKL